MNQILDVLFHVAILSTFWLCLWLVVKASHDTLDILKSMSTRLDAIEESIDVLLDGPPDDDPDDGEEPGVLTEDADAVGKVVPLKRAS